MPDFTVVRSETLHQGITALFGNGVTVKNSSGVAGGCINQGKQLTLSDGRAVFCKKNRLSYKGMFLAEAQGLTALRGLATRVAGPRVPRPLGLVETSEHQYLLLEWIDSGRRTVRGTEEFAVALAAMHAAVVKTVELPGYVPPEAADGTGRLPVDGEIVHQYGFVGNNYIGSTPQVNTWNSSWVDFFAENRIGYQLKLATKNGLANSSMRTLGEVLIRRLPDLLPEPECPSLVHGDLWSGNMMVDDSGSVAIIDPAVYLGHSEVDLAMMELFGSPAPGFFDAYMGIRPIQSGYEERREIYNLYHLLNHLNLFGSSYRGSVMRVLERFS